LRLLQLQHANMLLLATPNQSVLPTQVERPSNGAAGSSLVEVLEAKGLDMVRRDWSNLSKDTGNYVLQQILSGGCLCGFRIQIPKS
jgi:hypothetical protein